MMKNIVKLIWLTLILSRSRWITFRMFFVLVFLHSRGRSKVTNKMAEDVDGGTTTLWAAEGRGYNLIFLCSARTVIIHWHRIFHRRLNTCHCRRFFEDYFVVVAKNTFDRTTGRTKCVLAEIKALTATGQVIYWVPISIISHSILLSVSVHRRPLFLFKLINVVQRAELQTDRQSIFASNHHLPLIKCPESNNLNHPRKMNRKKDKGFESPRPFKL